MNAIQEVQDESIRKIAQTLRSSGLAMSEPEAVRMATMMSRTSQKVTQNFEQKKNGNLPNQNVMRELHVNVSSSVQVKPRNDMEKEEFILGDVQQQPPAQKKDPYRVENEFEEIVVQDLVETNPEVKAEPKPVQRQNQTFAEQKVTAPPQKQAWTPPRPVQVSSQSTVMHSAPVHQTAQPQKSSEAPLNVSAPSKSGAPVSAASSSQLAFSFMLGAAQKNPGYEEEVKKHTPQQAPVHSAPESHIQSHAPVQAPVAQAAPTHAPVQAPAQATISPQKKMMQEANVDITKMFNFNK